MHSLVNVQGGRKLNNTVILIQECSFELNQAERSGGAFYFEGPHSINCENNSYDRNSAKTGSVFALVGDSTLTVAQNIKSMIENDRFSNNVGSEGTLYATDLSFLHVYNTMFNNNTADNNVAGILITHSVHSFSCIKCFFKSNKALFSCVLSINYATNLMLDALSLINNDATFQRMIEIKGSLMSNVTKSDFINNYCSGVPCAISITNSEKIYVESCTFLSMVMNNSSPSTQGAVFIQGQYVTLDKLTFDGFDEYVMKSLASKGKLIKHISNLCPINYYFQTIFSNIMQGNSRNQTSQTSLVDDFENGNLYILKCLPCPINYQRVAKSSYSLVENIQIGHISRTETDVGCYKCPHGGVCKGKTFIADVNYWGFIHGNKLYFVFCFEEHCCQSSPCNSYDTCNAGHQGRLCTSCKNGYQLGFVNDGCILTEKCKNKWVYAMIIIAAFAYVGFLVITVEFMHVLKILFVNAKSRCNRQKGCPLDTSVEMLSEGKAKSSDQMKSTSLTSVPSTIIKEDPSEPWKIPDGSAEIFYTILYHLQDTPLFEIRFPGMPGSGLFLEGYKDVIVSLARLDPFVFVNQLACLQEGMTQVTKLILKTSIIPITIYFLLFVMFLVERSGLRHQIKIHLMSSGYQVFILMAILNSQQLSLSAFNLVNCIWLGSGEYLRIDTTVKCYQIWQWISFAYILLFILPFWLALFLGPGLLKSGKISVRMFIFGVLFPGPFIIYVLAMLYKQKKISDKAFCHSNTAIIILNDVWYSYKPFHSLSFLCWLDTVKKTNLNYSCYINSLSNCKNNLYAISYIYFLCYAFKVYSLLSPHG